jgi:aminoglycoside phosphotransferase (APT) family kinase protein
MEGVVVDLGHDLVAKTWHSRRGDELERLRSFYDAVAQRGLALATPHIVRILTVGQQYATVERKLGGRPLRSEMGDRSYVATDADVRCVVEVLAALQETAPTDAMSLLPVLEGEPPFAAAVAFGSSLAALVERRARRFNGVLTRAVPDLDRVVAAATSQLQAMRSDDRALIHGDLIPANILVDESRKPVGILDFGFLTTVGDPRFDAAVAASVFDMYGPRGQTSEAVLDAAIVDRFGYEQQTLHIYRAAYALTTSNCFSASGSDGHFAWCTAMLIRPAIRNALGM